MNNEPAFPHLRRYVTGNTYEPIAEGGMTLRDYFAAKAMQSLLMAGNSSEFAPNHIAPVAYSIADAMLEARKK